MESTIRVLIVDDAPYFRQALIHLFEREPTFRVVGQAGNGVEALGLVEVYRPHVVLVDYALPALNGLEISRQIKERFPEIQIILLSMFADDLKDLAAEAGACLCLGKDGDLTRLPRFVEGCYSLAGPGKPDSRR